MALVTGAAKRLGREIALGLAARGWDIAVHYGSSAAEAQRTVADIEALGRRAVALAADLADPAQCERLIRAAADGIGVPTCLVNNASRFAFDSPADVGFDTLQAHWGPNLAAPVVLTRQLHAALAAQGPQARGIVVNLLDQKLANLNADFFSYTLTKVALEAATRIGAMHFAPVLRVCGVSPGLTLPSYLQTEQHFERTHRSTALLDRSSEPQDIVAAVLYLVHSPAVTGVNLIVDGGQHLMKLARDVSYLG
ncbi:MAG: SDR family oxidoreductase [Burkholderiales bacterium]|nr:MAG: SDR family oxidoreductase [Burkholderiales bacterium]